jgi:hypothetical protein
VVSPLSRRILPLDQIAVRGMQSMPEMCAGRKHL